MSELEKFRLFSGDKLREELDFDGLAVEIVAHLYDSTMQERGECLCAQSEPAIFLRHALQLYIRSGANVSYVAAILAAVTAYDMNRSSRYWFMPCFHPDIESLKGSFTKALVLARNSNVLAPR
jgi:hypothetical protein